MEIYDNDQLHANAWPQVLAALKTAGFADYSIHFDPIHHLLIAHFTYIGDDFDRDMSVIAQDPVTQAWWEVTDEMQNSLVPGATGSGQGPWWLDLEQVFSFGETDE